MNIIKYYNQNAKKIWMVIIAIIITIIAIHSINDALINKEIKNNNENKLNLNKEGYKVNPNIDVVISEEEVKKEKELVIDQFIRYCNSGKLEDAYRLLSNDCKKNLYPTLEVFKQNYCNKIFGEEKLYSKEKFYKSTYKIKFYKDIMSTGKIENNIIEDYMTVIDEKDGSKVNISSYIYTDYIKKEYKDKMVNIEIINKDVYKEYIQYKFKITNLSNKDIILDDKQNTKSIYLTGKNNVEYYSMLYEKSLQDLIIPSKTTKTVTIKFSKDYNSNNELNSLVFSNVIENYNENIEKNKTKILINL